MNDTKQTLLISQQGWECFEWKQVCLAPAWATQMPHIWPWLVSNCLLCLSEWRYVLKWCSITTTGQYSGVVLCLYAARAAQYWKWWGGNLCFSLSKPSEPSRNSGNPFYMTLNHCYDNIWGAHGPVWLLWWIIMGRYQSYTQKPV